jgi:microcin C transport system permease protein
MAEQSSKEKIIPRDDLPREEIPERGEQVGPLDVPQEELGENTFQSLEDRMLARQSIAIRHFLPDTETEAGQSAQREIREAIGSTEQTGLPGKPARSVSILRKRFRKFKSLRRGYYSFLLLVILYALSFALPLLVNSEALIVHYKGETYFPVFKFYPGTLFGQSDNSGEAQYRDLAEQFKKDGGGNWVLMPPYPWNPLENDLASDEPHPQPPSGKHLLGTDDTGRDVFSRMCYGFNISISFAIVLTFLEYLLGVIIGGTMGYFGGKIDLIGQRVIEIWSNIPFLYTVIIVGSLIIPSFGILILILAAFQWIAISYYIRGEFYREKAKDYVAGAIALGATDRQIIFKHILPNSLTPMIAFLPFAIVGGISVLVSLDYLGFGLPPPTPSWGQMVDVGLSNLDHWWLIVTPLSALFVTLLLVTFIGEAIREAFDPRVFSRLR